METWVQKGERQIRVGSAVYRSSKWKSNFIDFLLFFIQHKFGKEWATKQKRLSPELAHPVYKQFVGIKASEQGQTPNERGFYTLEATGPINALLSLAYDLYICDHNRGIPSELLRRLRNADEYEGALYEAHVVGIFSRAGFSVEFEDERDKRRTHCEFTATNVGTGRKFSVEAKAVTTRSARSGDAASPPNFRGKLFDALAKRADHPRIIFIEANRHIVPTDGEPEWAPHFREQLAKAERDMVLEDCSLPQAAYVFVTNRPFLSQIETPSDGYQAAAAGFRIGDFPPERMGHLRNMHQARMRHIEAYQLFCAMSHTNPVPQHFRDDPVSTLFREITRGSSRDDIQHPFDAFDFVFSTYSKSSPEKLRSWLADHLPAAELAKMSRTQLAEEYSAGIGQSMMRDIVSKRNPERL